MDHREEALRLLEGLEDGQKAVVHAILALADEVRHGLRDVVYELRD